MAGKIKYLDHTGDVGIQISAATLEELFVTAAQAMFQIICPRGKAANDETFSIMAGGNNIEELLVDWLSELNFIFQTEGVLLGNISEIFIENNTLTASIAGERIDRQKHDIQIEIKAVTYHKLFVKKSKNGWRAQIIFDI
ncbi:MAG: archease [Actinobacteria bacterium]|nr:archease [Actinomycetota bacterium]